MFSIDIPKPQSKQSKATFKSCYARYLPKPFQDVPCWCRGGKNVLQDINGMNPPITSTAKLHAPSKGARRAGIRHSHIPPTPTVINDVSARLLLCVHIIFLFETRFIINSDWVCIVRMMNGLDIAAAEAAVRGCVLPLRRAASREYIKLL